MSLGCRFRGRRKHQDQIVSDYSQLAVAYERARYAGGCGAEESEVADQ
jgi:hypothetical protein